MTWAYLAGFIDGDGWISASMNSGCSTIRCTLGATQLASEKASLLVMANFLRNNGVSVQWVERISTGILQTRTPMVDIRIREQKSLIVVLNNILPYLLIKKKKAERCLRYLEKRAEQRDVSASYPIKQPTNVYWSEKEITELRNLHSSGLTSPAIASKLRRSVHSVSRKLSKMRIIRSGATRFRAAAVYWRG